MYKIIICNRDTITIIKYAVLPGKKSSTTVVAVWPKTSVESMVKL